MRSRPDPAPPWRERDYRRAPAYNAGDQRPVRVSRFEPCETANLAALAQEELRLDPLSGVVLVSARSARTGVVTLGGWIDQALAIERRRSSAARYTARDRHLACFPTAEVGVEVDRQLLERIISLRDGRPHGIFARPPRGHRAAAPQTPIITALRNHDVRLRALGLGGNQAPDQR